MTRRTHWIPTAAVLAGAITLVGGRPALADVPLVQYGGWRLSTDGRVNTFLSVGVGDGLPADEPDNLGAGTADYANSSDQLRSTRIRNGFLMSILGFTGQKQITPELTATTRVGLWMNITGSRTKNSAAQVDPRELYGTLQGRWGTFLAGSDLAVFGRAATIMDSEIAHNYGLGYPCGIEDASGGACGMIGFGEPFPGYEPGFVYTTPLLAGFQFTLGAYDPATIANAQLNRAPLPRFEGEARFEIKDVFRVFASGFWQVLEGTVADTSTGVAIDKNLHTNAWGVQAGAMLSLGPIMVGGAAYEGAGFSPITYIDDSVVAADSNGVLRDSQGAFGLAAILINSINFKIAGGAGVWHLDRDKNDEPGIMNSGTPTNPQLIKQNLGMTVGLYKGVGPVHFALEYFRAEHTWYDRGVASASDPNVIVALTPRQVVNFINAGMSIAW
jgi:predicted porin